MSLAHAPVFEKWRGGYTRGMSWLWILVLVLVVLAILGVGLEAPGRLADAATTAAAENVS